MPLILLLALIAATCAILVGLSALAVGLPFWPHALGSYVGYMIGLMICGWVSSFSGPLGFTELLFSKVG